MPIQIDDPFEAKPVRNTPWYYLFLGVGMITVGTLYFRKVPKESRPDIGIAFLGFVNILGFGLILKIIADLLRINIKAFFDTLSVSAIHLISFMLCAGLLVAYEWPSNVKEDPTSMIITVAAIILVVDVFALRHSFGLHFVEPEPMHEPLAGVLLIAGSPDDFDGFIKGVENDGKTFQYVDPPLYLLEFVA